jgi:hypothetical protein
MTYTTDEWDTLLDLFFGRRIGSFRCRCSAKHPKIFSTKHAIHSHSSSLDDVCDRIQQELVHIRYKQIHIYMQNPTDTNCKVEVDSFMNSLAQSRVMLRGSSTIWDHTVIGNYSSFGID